MKAIRTFGIVLGLVVAALVCWELLSMWSVKALGEDKWFYQYYVPILTYMSDDTSKIDTLFADAMVEQLDPHDFGITDEAWSSYRATWFYDNQYIHWFEVQTSPTDSLCYLLSFDTVHLYRASSVVAADCDVLNGFNRWIIEELRATVPQATPVPET